MFCCLSVDNHKRIIAITFLFTSKRGQDHFGFFPHSSDFSRTSRIKTQNYWVRHFIYFHITVNLLELFVWIHLLISYEFVFYYYFTAECIFLKCPIFFLSSWCIEGGAGWRGEAKIEIHQRLGTSKKRFIFTYIFDYDWPWLLVCWYWCRIYTNIWRSVLLFQLLKPNFLRISDGIDSNWY